MADLDPEEVRRRAYAALQSCDEMNARLAERAERRQREGSDWVTPRQPDPPPAPRRSPEKVFQGRDWQEAWIAKIADARVAGLRGEIAGLRGEIAEIVARVIAAERGRARKATEAALAEMRRELRSEFVKILGELRIETRAALVAGGDELARGLARVVKGIDTIERQLANIEYTAQGTLVRLDSRRPN